MLKHPTYDQPYALGLHGMAKALVEIAAAGEADGLGHHDYFGRQSHIAVHESAPSAMGSLAKLLHFITPSAIARYFAQLSPAVPLRCGIK